MKKYKTRFLDCIYDCLTEQLEFPQYATVRDRERILFSDIEAKKFDPETQKMRIRFRVFEPIETGRHPTRNQ